MPDPAPRLHDCLADASGGLRFHLRAWRHRRRWAAFHAAVADWLRAWHPDRPHLVLVGPSAGYDLPAGWLGGFTRITVLEPDPLARWLLRRRPDATRLHFDDLDCLATPDGLAHLKARFPDAAILFCNVLGQVTAPGGRGWAELCACHLRDLPWASLHDVVSTPRAPRADAVRASFPGGTSLEAVLAAFWPGGELPLVDHATFALGGDVPHHYVLWPLRPGRWHLVEWVAHAMQNDTSAMPDDAAGRGRAV